MEGIQLVRKEYFDATLGQTVLEVDALSNSVSEMDAKFTQQLAQKVYPIENIEHMKTATYFEVGDTVTTNGYYLKNDGGGGVYTIVRNDSLIDDGGLVHDLPNGLKAQLVTNKRFLNVKQFGARGNNYHDDTQAFKKALSVLNTSSSDALNSFFGGGTLYAPYGVYLLTDSLVVNVNVELLGDGINTWKTYHAKGAATVLKFDLVNKSRAAIYFKGYNADGSPVTGYYVSVDDSYTLKGSPDNVSVKNIEIESINGNIQLALDFINAPSHRVENVSIKSFQYAILTNCSWGASIDKLFSLTLYGGIVSYLSNNGISIKDSYITVTREDIPQANAIIPEIGTNIYTYKSFGIFDKGGSLSISNTIIESPSVAIMSIESKTVVVQNLHAEEIKKALVFADRSVVDVNGVFLWNQEDSNTPVNLIKVVNSAQTNVANASSNVQLVVSSNDDCFVNVTNCKDAIFDNRKTVSVDVITKSLITFNSAVNITWVANNVNMYAYKSERLVTINLNCTLPTSGTVGQVVTIGTLPSGYRPYFEMTHYTRKGLLALKTDGTITFTLAVADQYILNDIVTFLS